MRQKIFCCEETVFVNEWFRLVQHNATALILKKRDKDIQPENYVSDLNDNSKAIRLPKFISREGKITTIKPVDHLIYTAFLFLMLPYVLFHRAVIFITPPYFNTSIVPFLKLFRKKIYVIVLDPQTRLEITHKEKGRIITPYVKLALFLENMALRSATKIFAVSRFMEAECMKKNRNVFYTPNGADVKIIGKIKKKRKYREFTITYIGSFDPWRSVDLIVESFKLLERKRKNVRLLLIGGGGNIDKVREMTAGDKNIKITGWIRSNKDVISLCKGSDLLLMTPRKSPIAGTVSSIKCFEYIACEVPLLVTNTGEHAEWVEKLGTGLVVDADAVSISEGMYRMATDKKLYWKLKRNCMDKKYLVDFHETRKPFIEEISKDMGK